MGLRRVGVTGRAGEGLLRFAVLELQGTSEQGTVDINDIDALRRVFSLGPGDLMLHLAAFTEVDNCESQQGLAYQTNFRGALNVARVTADVGADILYVSTDYIFDGEATSPYEVDSRPNPLSVYGASKWAGELAVRDANPRHFIVRTSWLFGPGGTNFVDSIRAKAAAGENLRVVNDQRGSPTYTRDLAPALFRIADSRRYGTYHVTNRGSCTWFDLASRVAQRVAPRVAPEPITTEVLGRPAKRPPYSVLSNKHYESVFGPDAALPPWEDALDRYLKVTS